MSGLSNAAATRSIPAADLLLYILFVSNVVILSFLPSCMDRDYYGHVGNRKVQTEHRDNAGVFAGPSDKQVSVLVETKTTPVIDYS